MTFIRDEKLAYTNGLNPTNEVLQLHASVRDAARNGKRVWLNCNARRWTDGKWRVTILGDCCYTIDFTGTADSQLDILAIFGEYLSKFEAFFDSFKDQRTTEFPWEKE